MTKAHPQENDVKKEIKDLLDEFGWKHWPGSASAFSTGGVSDRLAVRGRPGRGCIFLAIEAKLKKADGSKTQEQFLADVRAQGAIGIVVNAAKVPKLRLLLETIDRHLFPEKYDPPRRYWHHPESGSLFITTAGEDGRGDAMGDGALVEELTEEQFAWWKAYYVSPLGVVEGGASGPPSSFGDFGWDKTKAATPVPKGDRSQVPGRSRTAPQGHP